MATYTNTLNNILTELMIALERQKVATMCNPLWLHVPIKPTYLQGSSVLTLQVVDMSA